MPPSRRSPRRSTPRASATCRSSSATPTAPSSRACSARQQRPDGHREELRERPAGRACRHDHRQVPPAELLGLRRVPRVHPRRRAARGARRGRRRRRSSSARTSGATAVRSSGCSTPTRACCSWSTPARSSPTRTRSACRSSPAAPSRTTRSSPTSTSSAARTTWSSTATASWSTARGTILARAPQFDEHLLVVDLDPEPATDAELPEDIQPGRRSTPPDTDAGRARRHRPPLPPRRRRAARRPHSSSGTPSCSAPGTTSRRTGSAVRDPRALRRHRLGRLRGDRRRRHRRRTRVYGVSMPSRSGRPTHSRSRRRRRRRAASVCGTRPSRSPTSSRPFERPAAPDRPGGRERPGACPGADPDGPVEPARPPRADHGQQDRAAGRLLDDLRRLGRRVRPDQGRAEDDGLGARPLAERARRVTGRDRADPENSITKPPSAELRPGQKDEDTLPPYEVLDGDPRAVRHARARARQTSSRWATTPRRSPRSRGWSTAPSGSAARARSARRSRGWPSAATGGCRSRTGRRRSDGAHRSVTDGRPVAARTGLPSGHRSRRGRDRRLLVPLLVVGLDASRARAPPRRAWRTGRRGRRRGDCLPSSTSWVFVVEPELGTRCVRRSCRAAVPGARAHGSRPAPLSWMRMPRDAHGHLTPGRISAQRPVPTDDRPTRVRRQGRTRTSTDRGDVYDAGRRRAHPRERPHRLAGHRRRRAAIRPGVTTDELDRIAHEFVVAHGAYPSTLGYRGLPQVGLHLGQRGDLPRHPRRHRRSSTATSSTSTSPRSRTACTATSTAPSSSVTPPPRCSRPGRRAPARRCAAASRPSPRAARST